MSVTNGFAPHHPGLAFLDQMAATAEVVSPDNAKASSPSGPGEIPVVNQAIQHLIGLPDPVEEESEVLHGRDRIIRSAYDLVLGFDMDVERARPILQEWNEEQCDLPWADSEVDEVLDAAAQLAAEEPDRKGFLLGGGGVQAGADGPANTDTARLIGIATSGVELFHAPDSKPFAGIPVGDHRETHMLRGPTFRNWLIGEFFDKTGRTPKAETLKSAMGVLEVIAGRGPTESVHVRLAAVPDPADSYDPVYYLDLGNKNWQGVEITRRGWKVLDDPPVRFRRPVGMLPLPTPARGGSLSELRDFVNITDDASWLLYRGVLIAAARPTGPYPILALNGEQGSAKTTTSQVTRRMIDPHVSALRSPPREERDLMIAAVNSGMLGYDNLSFVPDWLSDGLCRIATGGGMATRQLYTDDDEVFFSVQKPIIINGIEDVASRQDLLDRCVILGLPEIPEAKRREEGEFWRSFDAAHPRLLGALLDAVVGALAKMPTTELAEKPRMADFARWGEAASRGLGAEPGTFLKAYEGNRAEATEIALEASPVATAVRALVGQKDGPFKTTAADLLAVLGELVGSEARRATGWPKSPRGMTGALKRATAGLRSVGIAVEFERKGKQGTRTITITKGQIQSD